MPDDFDRAQAIEEAERAHAIAMAVHGHDSPVAWETASAKWCEAPGCGERIPDARRRAVPGCRFCANCQGGMEQQRKGHR